MIDTTSNNGTDRHQQGLKNHGDSGLNITTARKRSSVFVVYRDSAKTVQKPERSPERIQKLCLGLNHGIPFPVPDSADAPLESNDSAIDLTICQPSTPVPESSASNSTALLAVLVHRFTQRQHEFDDDSEDFWACGYPPSEPELAGLAYPESTSFVGTDDTVCLLQEFAGLLADLEGENARAELSGRVEARKAYVQAVEDLKLRKAEELCAGQGPLIFAKRDLPSRPFAPSISLLSSLLAKGENSSQSIKHITWPKTYRGLDWTEDSRSRFTSTTTHGRRGSTTQTLSKHPSTATDDAEHNSTDALGDEAGVCINTRQQKSAQMTLNERGRTQKRANPSSANSRLRTEMPTRRGRAALTRQI
ncbi:hypothetical protein QBC44DRAFT_368670 [Cladorrhinum sp. PSN332]|nr:hypothetical protein QBC44DRAFT_368670 [Cladorrhinum sp. PSN332]